MTEADFSVGPEALNPLDVEAKLLELVETLSKSLVEWKRLYKNLKDCERGYDAAYAAARLAAADAGVTPNDRKYHADLNPDVSQARKDKDEAEVLFKYAEERLRGVHAAIRAWQSVGTSVRQAYANAGRGEF